MAMQGIRHQIDWLARIPAIDCVLQYIRSGAPQLSISKHSRSRRIPRDLADSQAFTVIISKDFQSALDTV